MQTSVLHDFAVGQGGTAANFGRKNFKFHGFEGFRIFRVFLSCFSSKIVFLRFSKKTLVQIVEFVFIIVDFITFC